MTVKAEHLGHALVNVTNDHGGRCECGATAPADTITLPGVKTWHSGHLDDVRPPPPEPEPTPHLLVDPETRTMMVHEAMYAGAEYPLRLSVLDDGRVEISAGFADEYVWTLEPAEVADLREFLAAP